MPSLKLPLPSVIAWAIFENVVCNWFKFAIIEFSSDDANFLRNAASAPLIPIVIISTPLWRRVLAFLISSDALANAPSVNNIIYCL